MLQSQTHRNSTLSDLKVGLSNGVKIFPKSKKNRHSSEKFGNKLKHQLMCIVLVCTCMCGCTYDKTLRRIPGHSI